MNNNSQFNLALQKCETINLKRVKEDTFLMIIHYLLKDYNSLKTKNANNSESIINIKQDDLEFVEYNIASLLRYLEKNIITVDTLNSIFTNSKKSAFMSKLASSLEPTRAYYKYLINLFSTKLQAGSLWIPELFAFSLLYYYKKEHGKSLYAYPFFQDFPIEKVIEIYNKNNIELKKTVANKEDVSFWRIKTLLDSMYNNSEFITKKYLQYSFKINSRRVSKTRVKKQK
ncbi:MAG: hypothetical protein ACQERD_08240 [Campylobacterota bacterium]